MIVYISKKINYDTKIIWVSDYGSNVIGYPFLLWKRNTSITVPGLLPAGNTL